jgi:DNA mismatch repair ATPase MutS
LKGSFYELYGIYDPVLDKHENTVKQVADILDLQLKVYPNDVAGGKTGLFGGVPEHTIHKWAGKLGSLGWTSILIDQVKSASGEVTDRKVMRVISPGTHVECSEEDESMYVVSIWINTTAASAAAAVPSIGVSAAECSIGDVIHFEQEATGTLQTWHADSTAQFISTFQPKEVILNWNGNPIHCPEENTLRILFEIPQCSGCFLQLLSGSFLRLRQRSIPTLRLRVSRLSTCQMQPHQK